ncbi:MAG: hypothetical protein DMG57_26405 [Acidobacteria bacterium]|nr:MAG: hypothetical protein DMG57_26405 [Acidobacteriota bacterium]
MTTAGAIEPVALGFRSHSGWTVAVAVAGSPRNPVVIERCRLEIADAAIRSSKQPYHAAEPLSFEKAEALIERCLASSTRLANAEVSAMVAHLKQQNHKVVAAGILASSGRPLPELAATLQSHALIHTAEGEFFRDVLTHASERCSLPVTRIKEREIWDRGAAAFKLNAADLQGRINGIGKSIGPPWTQDEKWIALVESL